MSVGVVAYLGVSSSALPSIVRITKDDTDPNPPVGNPTSASTKPLPSPPLIHPARGPPQAELATGSGQPEHDQAAKESFPGDLDRSPDFDPADPEPIPDDNFVQSWGAAPPGSSEIGSWASSGTIRTTSGGRG